MTTARSSPTPSRRRSSATSTRSSAPRTRAPASSAPWRCSRTSARRTPRASTPTFRSEHTHTITPHPRPLVFVKRPEAKQRPKPALSAGNGDKTMSAPVTAIVAYDAHFYEQMPRLFPSRDMKSTFQGMPAEKQQKLAFMNGTLQGGYLILAARALGLDCGPMAGFDNAQVDATFFPNGPWKSNFLLNLGYGDTSKLFPRNPRLDFDAACRIE